MSEKEANPCDKCPWKNEETCEKCELKEKARINELLAGIGSQRATREVRRIRVETNQN